MNTPKSIYSKTVDIALDALAEKDRRIAELEAQIAGDPAALAAAKREVLEATACEFEKLGWEIVAAEVRRLAREMKP